MVRSLFSYISAHCTKVGRLDLSEFLRWQDDKSKHTAVPREEETNRAWVSLTALLFRSSICRLALNTLWPKHLGSHLANNSELVMRKVPSLSAERLPFFKTHFPVCWWPCCVLLRLGCDTDCHHLHPNYICPQRDRKSHIFCRMFWDNPSQIAVGNHCRSDPSQVGLAYQAGTLRPRSWVRFKLSSEDGEKNTRKVAVTFYWQKSVAQEAVFLYSVKLTSAQLHVYWMLVWLNDVNRQACFVLGSVLFLTLKILFLFFFSVMMILFFFPLPLFKASLWFPLHNHQKVWV